MSGIVAGIALGLFVVCFMVFLAENMPDEPPPLADPTLPAPPSEPSSLVHTQEPENQR